MRRYLRLRTVTDHAGLSKPSIYRLITLGLFPKPYPLGARAVGWADDEIEQWLEDRIAARDAKQNPACGGVRSPVPKAKRGTSALAAHEQLK
jgi:prophage regulatory protein